MEARRNEIKNTSQYVIADNFCRKKHPAQELVNPFDPSAATSVQEPVELMLVSGIEPSNAHARPAIAAVSLTHVALAHDGQEFGSGVRSHDFRWYTRVDTTNRNQFPLSALIVGVTQRGVKRCDWDAKSYPEVYQCNGYAGSGMSGSFKCYMPDSEKRLHAGEAYCAVGLGIMGTLSDLSRYLPSR
ncbi:hypothetical protein LMG9673_00752 [Ralstonia pseudosolanacearum]|nr:hypothetical protein LMG9673_00752 [Ralstonia pseudosolanacearum]